MFTYLAIDLLSLIFPLVFSRSTRFGFGKNVLQAWIAVVIASIPFILWDIFFTRMGVWSFNPKFLMEINLLGLPLEELLFFWTIPFASLFIYIQFRNQSRLQVSPSFTTFLWCGLTMLFLTLAIFHRDKNYTLAVSLLGACTSSLLAWQRPKFSSALFLGLLIHYIPFFLVNGLLTYLPVVLYHPQEILEIYFGTIPVEDSIYSFVMLVSVVCLFEFLRRRKTA